MVKSADEMLATELVAQDLGSSCSGVGAARGAHSLVCRLAGRDGAVTGRRLRARGGRSNARPESRVVAPDRAHSLFPSAVLLAENTAANRRVAARVRLPRNGCVC